MRQSVPQVAEEDVGRVVRRDFPAAARTSAMEMLDEYGSETWHREPVRVRLAALKMAGGDAERLRSAIRLAKLDYRDLLVLAEYPEYRKLGHATSRLPEQEKARVYERDRLQYAAWLKEPNLLCSAGSI